MNQVRLFEQPAHLDEYFRRLAARYRSQGIHTPSEWPMNTSDGREAYRESMERERLLEALNREDLRCMITRAEERLSAVPYGCVISFDNLTYGKEVH